MREIKFRAWHLGYDRSVISKPIPPQMLHDDKPGDCLVYKNQGQPVKVMQFTGLKDRNGKDIYEGDILKSDNGNIGEVKWDDQYGVWRNWCRKSKSCLCLNMPFPLWNSFHNPKSIEFKATVEVIGNIYEHSYLLK